MNRGGGNYRRYDTSDIDPRISTRITGIRPRENFKTPLDDEEGELPHDLTHINNIPIQYPMTSQSLSCKDVYDHVSKCEVCKKIYNDKSLYLLIIALLAIVCIILMKKVLENK